MEYLIGERCEFYSLFKMTLINHENCRASAIRERNLRLGSAVCLPSSCSTSKVRNYVNETILASADLVITNDYDQSMFCSTKDSIPIETIDIIAMYVFNL